MIRKTYQIFYKIILKIMGLRDTAEKDKNIPETIKYKPISSDIDKIISDYINITDNVMKDSPDFSVKENNDMVNFLDRVNKNNYTTEFDLMSYKIAENQVYINMLLANIEILINKVGEPKVKGFLNTIINRCKKDFPNNDIKELEKIEKTLRNYYDLLKEKRFK